MQTYDPDRWLYEGETLEWRDAFTEARPAEFYECTFVGCGWREATTRRWVLEDCRFERCDLSLWRPVDCTFAGVRFHGCKLLGVDWTVAGGVRFDVKFDACDLSMARFTDLTLTHAEFADCRLRDADLSDATLRGVALDECDLEGADVTGADLREADLRLTRGLALDPNTMLLAGARVSVEDALAIVRGLGLRTD